MNAEQLDQIQALADAATEGPWEHEPYGGQNQNGDYAGGHIIGADGEYVISEVPDNDGAFIAAARSDVPALLATVREQAAKIERVEALIEKPFASADKRHYADDFNRGHVAGYNAAARLLRAALATAEP